MAQGDIQIFPNLVNSFRLYTKSDLNEYNQQSYCGEDYEQFTHGVADNAFALVNETYQIQFQSSYENFVGTVKRYDSDELVAFLVPSIVFATADTKFYQVNVTFQEAGLFRIELAEDSYSDLMISEVINVLTAEQAQKQNYQHFEFSNYINTPYNIFELGFKAKVFLPVQSHERMPATTKTYFKDSGGFSTVLEQNYKRKIKVNFYQLPPSLIEMLSACFTLSDITFRGSTYVSEEGLEQPVYKTRYLLANTSIVLEEKDSYNQDMTGVSLAASMVNSFRFYHKESSNDYDKLRYCEEDYKQFTAGTIDTAFVKADGTGYQFQFRSKYSTHTAVVREFYTSTQVDSILLTKEGDIDDYSVFQGLYIPDKSHGLLVYIEIKDSGNNDTLITDPIAILNDDQVNSQSYQDFIFSNYKNTAFNVFESLGNFSARITLPVQSFERMPANERNSFVDAKGSMEITEQDISRKIKVNFYQLPPSVLELLSVCFTVSNIRFRGGDYVSEEGLEDIAYFTRYLPVNASIVLEEKKSYVPSPTFVELKPFLRDYVFPSIDNAFANYSTTIFLGDNATEFEENEVSIKLNGEDLLKGYVVEYVNSSTFRINKDVFSDDIIVVENRPRPYYDAVDVTNFNELETQAQITNLIPIGNNASEFESNQILIELNEIPLRKGVEVEFFNSTTFLVNVDLFEGDEIRVS